MKKLMIAAVVAASVGVTFADTDAIYDFTASLKTTVGKMGKDSKTTTTYNLGWNGVTFWYDDAQVIALPDEETTLYRYELRLVKAADNLSASLCKVRIGKVTEAETISETLIANLWTRKSVDKKPELNKKLENDQYVLVRQWFGDRYNQKSLNKWCATYKVITYTDAACYRVSGTEKIKAEWGEDTDCCSLFTMLQRFGAQTSEKATKVEIFEDVSGLFETENSNRSLSTGYIAGQGTWSAKLAKDWNDEDFQGASSISGNIVGILDAPDCLFCCDYPQGALAFDCAELDAGVADTTLDTAAYGTFTIKFNKSKSFKEDK